MTGAGGASALSGGSGASVAAEAEVASVTDLRGRLESVLAEAGLDGDAVTVFADAALLAGTVSEGGPVAEAQVRFVPASAPRDREWGISREAGDPGSVDAHCGVADRAQVAVETVNQVISRLERVRLAALGEGVVAMGRAELARRDLTDPADLSAAGRERWRSRSKSRVRQDLAPATGWSRAETASMVAVATAPAPFRVPVASALSRGTVTWVLVRALWRACDKARLSAADAAHVAEVMLADDPASCVPERLATDGSAVEAPWGHGAFWAALDREVTKLAACPDPGDEASAKAAEEARAAREAAYAGRSMQIRVGEDGTAQVFFTGTVLKVLALGDRLDRAARAARGAGDARTVVQLANDIGLALLGHATIGAHELPDLDIFQGGQPTPEDLVAAGWTPEVIAALSSLPAAVLQVVVPLLALHDPAVAHTLPGVGRHVDPGQSSPAQAGVTRPGRGAHPDDETGDTPEEADLESVDADPGGQGSGEAGSGEAATGDAGHTGGAAAGDAEHTGGAAAGDAAHTGGAAAGDAEHTGAPGCPACVPSVRAARNRAVDRRSRAGRQDDSAGDQTQDDSACDQTLDEACGEGSAHDQDRCQQQSSVPPRPPRVAWVGRVLGKCPGFVEPSLIRRLALSPGSTLVRLLVDPADGRCLERSTTAYAFDAAMRAQLAAADVTCRAPGCEHHAGACQVDHVTEFGTAGGCTKESNAQLLDTWHHDPKTAKAWDAVLHANRDVTWTTTLSRVYRTRVHDYRELVTVITDALERVAVVPEEDVADQINLEVYQALCYRGQGERLNEGDDDTDEETHLARFGGDITVGLSHRDAKTGRRAPGPSPVARSRADAAAALARTAPPHDAPTAEVQSAEASSTDTSDVDTSDIGVPHEGGTGPGEQPRYPGGRRWGLTDRGDDRLPRTPWSRDPDFGPPPF